MLFCRRTNSSKYRSQGLIIVSVLVISFAFACGSKMAQVQVAVGNQRQIHTLTERQASHLAKLTSQESKDGIAARCSYWTKITEKIDSLGMSKQDQNAILWPARQAQQWWCSAKDEEARALAEKESARDLAEQQRTAAVEEQEKRQAEEKAEREAERGRLIETLLERAERTLKDGKIVEAHDNLVALEGIQEDEVRSVPGLQPQPETDAPPPVNDSSDLLGNYLAVPDAPVPIAGAWFTTEQRNRLMAISEAFEKRRPQYEKWKAKAEREKKRVQVRLEAERKREADREEAKRRAWAAAEEREARREQAAAEREERQRKAQGMLPAGAIVATFRGEGVTNTHSFSVKRKWRIEWSSRDDVYIFIKNDQTGRSVEAAGGGAAGASVIRKSGTFFLTVTGTEAWAISVTQL